MFICRTHRDEGVKEQCFKILEFKPYKDREDVKFYHHKTEGYVLNVDGNYLMEDGRKFPVKDIELLAKAMGIKKPNKEDLHEILYIRAIKKDKNLVKEKVTEQRNIIRKILGKDPVEYDETFITNCRRSMDSLVIKEEKPKAAKKTVKAKANKKKATIEDQTASPQSTSTSDEKN